MANETSKITKCCLCGKSLLTEWKKSPDRCNVTRDVLIDNGAKDIPTSGYTYHTFKNGKKAVFPVCTKCYEKTVKKAGKDPKKPDTIKASSKKKATITAKVTTNKKK